MRRMNPRPPAGQHGLVLISTLLLLLVVTILAVGMFRSFGTQEKIAGNIREKQRALHAAQSALQYAEWWLSSNPGNASMGQTCTSLVDTTAGNPPVVCANPLYTMVTDVAAVPWTADGAEIGVTYQPPGMNVATVGVAGSYYEMPRFYISYIATVNNSPLYQIDAVGYGGSPDAVAVVESTYVVTSNDTAAPSG